MASELSPNPTLPPSSCSQPRRISPPARDHPSRGLPQFLFPFSLRRGSRKSFLAICGTCLRVDPPHSLPHPRDKDLLFDRFPPTSTPNPLTEDRVSIRLQWVPDVGNLQFPLFVSIGVCSRFAPLWNYRWPISVRDLSLSDFSCLKATFFYFANPCIIFQFEVNVLSCSAFL